MNAGDIYRHYKGNRYRVISVALHSESLEEFVVYECLYENPRGQVWVRPLHIWNEFVERDGKKIPRFTKEKGE